MAADKARSSRSAAARVDPEQVLPAITGVVESEIVPRLLAAHQARQRAEAAASGKEGLEMGMEFIAGFAASLIGGDDRAARARVEQLRHGGMTAEAVCLQALTPVARYLGDEWMNDRCSFLDVTTATAALHGIMNELRPAFQNRVVAGAERRRMTLFTAPGEQHRFGLSMLAEFFRRDGWQVALPTGTTIKQITTLLTSRPTDVVGFSAGSDRHLGILAACIAALRASSRNPDVVVMVGGPVFLERPELAQVIGADGTAACAEEAVTRAGALLAARRTSSRSQLAAPSISKPQAGRRPARASARAVAAACGPRASHAP